MCIGYTLVDLFGIHWALGVRDIPPILAKMNCREPLSKVYKMITLLNIFFGCVSEYDIHSKDDYPPPDFLAPIAMGGP